MLTTTFRQLREFKACTSRYRHLAKALGGIKHYGNETSITLKQVFDICGCLDTYWLITKLWRQDYINNLQYICYTDIIYGWRG